jgi:hypothetical protein
MRRREAHVSWLSLKTKVDGLSLVWPQNHWDGLSVVCPQNHWDSLPAAWPQNHWAGFSRFGLKTGGDGFSWFGLKTGAFGFPDLGLKTGSYGLVMWASKSPRWFISLGLKVKRASVGRLRHKIDGRMKMT